MPEEKPEEKEESQSKKCIVYYKTGWLNDSRHFFGDRLDILVSCCDQFSKSFFNTGNRKNMDWNRNELFEERPGLNFCKRGDGFYVLFNREPIQFCPWSGHQIEIKKSKDVIVREKIKEVQDGYEEEKSPEGWDR